MPVYVTCPSRIGSLPSEFVLGYGYEILAGSSTASLFSRAICVGRNFIKPAQWTDEIMLKIILKGNQYYRSDFMQISFLIPHLAIQTVSHNLTPTNIFCTSKKRGPSSRKEKINKRLTSSRRSKHIFTQISERGAQILWKTESVPL